VFSVVKTHLDFAMMQELKDKRVCIVGLGRSAVGAARLLLREGAKPFVTDSGTGVEECKAALDALGVAYEVGGHSEKALDAVTELVVVSPGVPANAPLLQVACKRSIPVIAELELGWRFCDAPVVAVTGTNGKTTTTTLLHAMVAACGHKAALAGNNATPLSEAVLAETPWDFVVAEVSSYQLETIDTFRPRIAAVLNLTPDHLGRHGDMAGYAAAKARLFMNMGAGDVAVLNSDDPHTARMQTPDGVQVKTFSVNKQLSDAALHIGAHPPITLESLRIPGRHNVENALAALTVAEAAGLDWNTSVAALQAFQGVEHRIEFVAETGGVAVYNDSKSTNADSLRVALESFPGKPVVLIAGGRGKGGGYAELRGLVEKTVRHMVCIGEDAERLAADLGDLVAHNTAASMAEAVALALSISQPGDVLLLSPACASFDWYRNYEERGADFKQCVLQQLAKAD